MKHRVGRFTIYMAAFLLPAAGYSLLYFFLSRAANNRIGYILWLWASTEDRLNFFRLLLIDSYFKFILPLLAGLVGVGWVYLRVMRRRRPSR